MKPDAELPVIRLVYEFTVWLIPKIGKFPRDLRFTLGETLERQTLTILEQLIRARYRVDRAAILEDVNTELEVLRYLLRVAHELRALPGKAYGDSATKLVEIGQQVGGWKKASERRRES